MGRNLLAAVILLGLAPALPAQENDVEMELFFSEEETVTVAARHQQRLGMSPSAVTVIDEQDIAASGATGLIDLLRLVPGLDVVIDSPAFSSVSNRLDWTIENNQLLVLIDGREANFELLGMTAFEIQPVSVDDIKRIEVIRGPGSSLYGANALSGVIAITTHRVEEGSSAWVGLRGGELGALYAGLRAGVVLGDWSLNLSAALDRMSTFSDRDVVGRRIWRLRPVLEWRPPNGGRLLLEGGLAAGRGRMSAVLSGFDGRLDSGYLRADWSQQDLRIQLWWTRAVMDFEFHSNLELGPVHLADLVPTMVTGDVVDGEVQWTLPRWYQPLLLIVGANGRFSRATSDQLLDGGAYADPSSSGYRQPGIEHLEGRAGAFAHGEWAPVDWLMVTAGLRFDYNTVTGPFLSPRLATVFKLGGDQFLRLDAARSFRKPSFFETHAHLMVDFPPDSPVTGSERQSFLDFMTRVVGNENLANEQLLAFEAGYLGSFLNGRLTLSADLFLNFYVDEAILISDVKTDAQGRLDLEQSIVRYQNADSWLRIVGGELTLRWFARSDLLLEASWAVRQVLGERSRQSPQNLGKLGIRWLPERGLVLSLYGFTRSEFLDEWVTNPDGILEPWLVEHFSNQLLLLGRLGWRFQVSQGELEAGLRLFLPVSLDDGTLAFRELGGGVAADGQPFGGDRLRRLVTVYLQGRY